MERVAFDDPQLIVQVLPVPLQRVIDDVLRPAVAHDAFAREHLDVDHRATHARRHAQRRVFYVGGFFAKDCAQQLFFRRQLGLTLRRDFADQHIAGVYFGADVDDARIVEPAELILRKIGDIASDFFRPELRVACDDVQLFDMDRRVAVIRNDTLRDQDRVFEVVPVPRHERDQHVLPERKLAQIGRCAIGHDVALGNRLAFFDDRRLVDVRVLIRARVLGQVVDVDADLALHILLVVNTHDDAVCINVIDGTAAQCLHGGPRVDCNSALDAGTDERLFRPQAGHRLALHVRTHQCAVRVIVLEERDQRRRDRHDLRRRNVHVLNATGRHQHELAVFAAADQLVLKLAALVERRVRLCDDVLALFDRRQIRNVGRDLAAVDLAIRRFEKTVFVQLRVQRHRIDQANVRPFRRFNRAYATVVRRMHVSYFEAGTLARQSARSQCRDTALVRDLGQRVGLVHELAQLRRAEKLANRRADWLAVDQVMRHQVFGLGLAQALLDRALHANQAGTELVFCQFANDTHPAVTEVIDIVDLAAPIAQLDQQFHRVGDVFVRQRHRTGDFGPAEAAVDFHAAHARQVVRVFIEEQAAEQRLDRVLGRWLARTHHPINRDARR